MYHILLILWPIVNWYDWQPLQVLQIDIKDFQCFDHCLTEGHLRGTPWSLVGKIRGEQTSGQTIKGHAADMSEPSQLTAGDVPSPWYLSNWNLSIFLRNIEHGSTSASLVPGVAVRTLRQHGAIAAKRLAG